MSLYIVIPLLAILLGIGAVAYITYDPANRGPAMNPEFQNLATLGRNYTTALRNIGYIQDITLTEYLPKFSRIQESLSNLPEDERDEHFNDLVARSGTVRELHQRQMRLAVPETPEEELTEEELEALDQGVIYSESNDYYTLMALLAAAGDQIVGKPQSGLINELQQNTSLLWALKHKSLISVKTQSKEAPDEDDESPDSEVRLTEYRYAVGLEDLRIFGVLVGKELFDLRGNSTPEITETRIILEDIIQKQISHLEGAAQVASKLLDVLKGAMQILQQNTSAQTDFDQLGEEGQQNYYFCFDLITYLIDSLSPAAITPTGIVPDETITTYQGMKDIEQQINPSSSASSTEESEITNMSNEEFEGQLTEEEEHGSFSARS